MQFPSRFSFFHILAGSLTVLTIHFCASPIYAQAPSQEATARVEGIVRDSSGHPVASASVSLTQPGHRTELRSVTNDAGAFSIGGIPPGSYSMTLAKRGFRNATEDSIKLSPAQKKHCEFILQTETVAASTGSQQSFGDQIHWDDRPSFTVAGVTDSTASGGHAAETRLRTGEALAKEALKLKGEESAAHSPAASLTSGNPEVERALRTSLRRNPTGFEPNHEAGEFYLRAGKYPEAVPLLNNAYSANPQDHANAVDLLFAMQYAGQLTQARERAQDLLAGKSLGRSEQADFHRMLGDIQEKSNDPLEAVHEYERAAALDASEQNYFAWGSELLLHRAAAPAIEVFGKGVHLHPESARMLAALGVALFTSGSAVDGSQRVCDATDLDPSNPAPYLFLGKMQEATSSPLPCAEQKLARFAEKLPNSARANYYYGLALWKRHRGAESQQILVHARTLFEKAAAIDSKLDVAYLQLGNLEYSQASFAAAIAAYQKAIAANPEGSEAHYRLGLAYKRAGENARAQAEFDRFKQLDRTEAERVERQRREIQQFLFVLKGQPTDADADTTNQRSSSPHEPNR